LSISIDLPIHNILDELIRVYSFPEKIEYSIRPPHSAICGGPQILHPQFVVSDSTVDFS